VRFHIVFFLLRGTTVRLEGGYRLVFDLASTRISKAELYSAVRPHPHQRNNALSPKNRDTLPPQPIDGI
ncbi:MAG: hypothetical protein V4587_08320, partial [Acidobacteriota bacterium]